MVGTNAKAFLEEEVGKTLKTGAKVVEVCNGRGGVENRVKEGKNTLRWDKTTCHRFVANQSRLKLARRVLKTASRISYHPRR